MQGFKVPARFRFRELVNGGQACLKAHRCKKQFYIFPLVPDTACPKGYAGLTILSHKHVLQCDITFFFFRSFCNGKRSGFLHCLIRQSPGIERNELAISIPVAPAWRRSKSKPEPLTRGWEAAGLQGART